MNKKLVGFILAVIIGLVWFGYQKISRPVQYNNSGKPVVKIGVSLPLSGDMSAMGKVMNGAIELAEQDLANRDTKYSYQFVVEDNVFDSKRAALVNQKLMNVDKVDAIIDFASIIGLVTAPMAEKNKIIHISSCASDAKVAEGKYNFIHWTQPEDEVVALVEKIKADGFNNIVIFTQLDQAMIAISENLQAKLANNQISFVEIRTNPGEKDFKMHLEKTSKNKPELYVLLEYSPTLDIILKRLKEQGNQVPVTSIESFRFLEDKSVIEGQWFVDAAESDSENYERFTKHNDSENVFGVGNTYDAAMLLVEAFEKAETKDKAVDELSKIGEYSGVVGQLLQDKQGIFRTEAIVKQIKNGKPVAAENI